MPLYKANTDLVWVYVSVREGRSTVGALQASDFALTDRGVPQTPEMASSDAVPIDVTLVVDTSGSVVNSLPLFRAEVQTIVGLLQSNEQIRLITFDTEVRQILPMQSPSERPPVHQMQLGETTSLVDAIVVALARKQRPERRHLVFVFTDGYDTSSMVGYGALAELASHTDSIVHVALVKPSGSELPSIGALAALRSAATRTGGSLNPPTQYEGGIVAAFQRAIDDFRHSYVLYFTPTGVTAPGWHDLSVKVMKPGNFDVRAREGYFGR
jgi:VWFA-related protein